MSGRPVVVISPNGIEYKALKELNMNIDDLLESIRQCNFYSFDQILYAIIETNGKMSVIPTSACSPTTAQDFNIQNPPAKLPHVIISDGKIIKEEMKLVDLDNKKLNKILNYIKIKSLKDLIILSIDSEGKTYYQKKGEKFQLIEDIKKEVKL